MPERPEVAYLGTEPGYGLVMAFPSQESAVEWAAEWAADRYCEGPRLLWPVGVIEVGPPVRVRRVDRVELVSVDEGWPT